MVHAGNCCLRRLAEGRATRATRFGRLLRHPQVTVESIIAGWSTTTISAVAGRHVLAIQDTSEINFRTSEDHTRRLGVIGKGTGRETACRPIRAIRREPACG